MAARPLVFDLFCGLGGWAEGFLAEDFDVIGFDIERHRYPERMIQSDAVKIGGNWSDRSKPAMGFNVESEKRLKAAPLTGAWKEYSGHLVLQDVMTIHGSQFRDAAVIVASPPCQEFSYMAMPWKRAKQIARALRGQDEFPAGYAGSRTIEQLTALFDACFRIQREASEAAGRHIPLVVENVVGAQAWVGPARARYGSFYLWGDVPALMPRAKALKVSSQSGRRTDPGNGVRFTSRDCGIEQKQPVWFNDDKRRSSKCGGDWFGSGDDCSLMRRMSSKSSARKQASAEIAKIPFDLANWIARAYKPAQEKSA